MAGSPTTPDGRRIGPTAAPRRRLSPEFIAAVRTNERPIWQLAVLSGFGTATSLSPMLQGQGEFPATKRNVDRLERLADVLQFPRELMFVPEPTQADDQPDIKTLRSALTRVLHVIAPHVPLIDCAAKVNRALDNAEDGDLRDVAALKALLQLALDASDRAEREQPK